MTAATAADMATAAAAADSRAARAAALAASRREFGTTAALRFLPRALAVTGVAQGTVAVVGARTVACRRGVRALALGGRLAI